MIKSVDISELKALIELCKLNDTAQKFKGEITPSLQQIASKNGVAAWIYKRYKSGLLKELDDAHMSQWKSVYFNNTILYQKYLQVFNKVQVLLKEKGIPLIGLKGIALSSELYSDEGLRPMSDIDILVPEGKGSEALEVLLMNGGKQTVVPRSEIHEQIDAHVRAIKVDGILVEIHQRLFSVGSVFYLKNTDRFSNSVSIEKQDIVIERLNDKLMAYHLVAHAIKGIQMGGLRLGWLLDIALLIKPIENKEAFIQSVLSIKPKHKKALREIFNMALLFIPDQALTDTTQYEKVLAKICHLMEEKDLSAKHRLINLFHLVNVPGFKSKIKLIWHEFFPQKSYMNYRYQTQAKESLWRLYAKRLIRR